MYHCYEAFVDDEFTDNQYSIEVHVLFDDIHWDFTIEEVYIEIAEDYWVLVDEDVFKRQIKDMNAAIVAFCVEEEKRYAEEAIDTWHL